ncbi:MAG: tRNA preQ1(34) S-adenosylmethionine ribosyltransferase-isomerase QueA [Hydrogenothermaceae bacterium]|nr:tRNA preQ1(34) S-adenosylmethionine ribosyltransferase-isomerase QueA [Hydrogenothermaceae bacterium]
MDIEEFNYHLPRELIAKYPIEPRDSCRLLVLDRESGKIEHRIFRDIEGFMNEGDLLILNNSKVIPAKLIGEKEGTKTKIEVFLVRQIEEDVWYALIKNIRRLKKKQRIMVGQNFFVEFLDREGEKAIIKLHSEDLTSDLERYGHVPLPPYIEREGEEEDKQLYQTVFAQKEGSVASPTAGLHFTEILLERLKERGVRISFITLHVGLGTFKPIKTRNIEEHKMHEEFYTIPEETLELIEKTKSRGRSVIAVGTTVVRTLESFAKTGIKEGFTDIFIYPPYRFKIVDKLITNFHLPKSTLILLVSAFAGKDKILNAYNEAIQKGYRFYSYGDAMFII